MNNKAFSFDEDIEQQELSCNNVVSKSTSFSEHPNDGSFNESCSSTILSSEVQPININRHIFYTEDFYNKDVWHLNCQTNHKTCNYNKNNKKYVSFVDSTRNVWQYLLRWNTSPNGITSKSICLTWLQTLLPILHWLPNYHWKRDLLSDIIAGCTILALHIPQGLAYARLAGVEAIHGLYVSLFPVFIYAILGTSKQVSIGTFAVISIACKDALDNLDIAFGHDLNMTRLTLNETSTMTPDPNLPSAIDILTTLCLFVGIIQFLLGFFHLGIMSIILSETLISAFVTACSIHVFTSQIFALIDIESGAGQDSDFGIPFDILKYWIRFIVRIPQANLTTLLISTVSIMILTSFKYGLEPFIANRFKFNNLVIPIDIVLIIFATLISALIDLNGQYQVKIIPKIPKAFEGMPKVPDTSYFAQLYGNAILITLVSYVSTYSLGKMYGKQHGYEVSANQELIALGVANIFSAFLLCYPCSGSLARSAVMNKLGARTQLASIVACILMVLFLLFFSAYLHTLPKSVLSCIIIVALYSTMKQIKEIKTAWHLSKLDGVLWMVTFSLVILFGVGPGLLYSVLFSFVILILKLVIPIMKLKRQVNNSGVFVEIEHIYDIYDNRGHNSHNSFNSTWIVFEFQGPLIFINCIIFRNEFNKLIGRYLLYQRTNKEKRTTSNKNLHKGREKDANILMSINTIIFDCTRLTCIDTKGVETLTLIVNTLEKHGLKMVLASCSKVVFASLQKNGFFDQFNVRHCYMSVLDAIADIERSST